MTPRQGTLWSLGAAGVGAVGLAIGLGVATTRTWFAYLDAWLFGVTIALGALIVNMIGHAAKAGWMVTTRRLTECLTATIPLFALLFVPLVFGLGHVYPWVEHVDSHKARWLDSRFFVARTVVYFGIFWAVSGRLRVWSRLNDASPKGAYVARMRRLGGGGLPVVGLTLTWASFDWSMSLQPDWDSTMFGFYFFTGGFAGAVGLLAWLLRSPRAAAGAHVTPDHAQALGRLLLTAVILWAYCSFGQLVIIWIGDIPREVAFYDRRTHGSWTAITYVLVFGHFVLPFLALLNRRMKRHGSYLAAVGGWMVFMHYVDVYWQVLPVHDGAGFRPHWADLAALLFVGGLSCAWSLRSYLGRSPLPRHVPELVDGLDYEAAV